MQVGLILFTRQFDPAGRTIGWQRFATWRAWPRTLALNPLG